MEASKESSVGKLSVDYRTEGGKSPNRRLRTQGRIPAVCYGKGGEPFGVSLDPTALMRALDPVKKTNTVINLTVKGGPGGDQTLLVMLRDHQKDAIKGNLIHADFIRVSMDKDVHAVVPVVLIGKPEGVKDGGILHQVFRTLEIACTPDKIPDKIEVDVTPLKMGDAIHVRDLKLGAGVKPLVDGGASVCSVTAPKAEKVETPVEAVPAEGAAAAAPADGKAPAAGAPAAAGAAPAGGAAPAPAKGEKKK
jgi:large subunit ribosomal protein L25